MTSSKLAEAFFRGRYQNNTTNSAPTGLTVQFGWGYIQGDSTPQIEENITFPTAFSAVPTMFIAYNGNSGTVPTGQGDGSGHGANSAIAVATAATTATGFQARIDRSDATSLGTNYFIYSWMAIGVV